MATNRGCRPCDEGADFEIQRVEVVAGKVRLFRRGDYVMRQKRFPTLLSSGVDERISEVRDLITSIDIWADG